MRFILCVLCLSVIALCLAFALDSAGSRQPGLSAPESLLKDQAYEKATEIISALEECNKTSSVSWEEGTKMFELKPKLVPMTQAAKCLIDCTMRKIGLMKENGFQAKEYVIDIKQLLRNYTTLDLASKEPHFKEEYLAAVKKFNHSYDVILAYEGAANECKNKQLLYEDKCDTTFHIAQCIVEEGVKQGYHIAVFPFTLEIQ